MRVLVAVALLLGVSNAAAAQDHVRVVRDQSIVWRLTSATPLTTVKAGTVLEVVGRDGDWFVVRLPPREGMPEETGRIAASQVESVSIAPTPGQLRRPAAPRRPAESNRPGFYGFAQAGLNAWLANKTFEAVLGNSVGTILGGGGRVVFRDHIAVDVAADRFEKAGQRVFVFNGEAFKLGIRDTVRVVPIFVTATYRQRRGWVTPYSGGGIGRYSYRETSDFADPAENVSAHFTSYHVVLGAELGNRASIVRLAVEGQLTTVPKAFGTTGAAGAFDEHNLGGFQLRLKILAGR